MAYYGGSANVPVGGSTFGGFAGGYNQTPAGIVPTANLQGSGAVYTMGTNLPSVDPNNYPGTVHFGPSTTVLAPGSSQFLPGAGYVDPNLAASGSLNYNAGF